MLNIVFDTNVLRSQNLQSANMKILKKLIESEKLKIYIPNLVKNEYLTFKQDELKKKLKRSDIIDVDRYFTYDIDIKEKLSNIEKELSILSEEIKYLVEREFDEWIYKYNIEILEFDNTKMTDVMNNYFSGGSVFQSIKSRKDIPDAMIFTSIEQLSYEVTELNVINNDNYFRECLNTIFGVNAYASIKDFLDLTHVKETIKIVNRQIYKYEMINSFLISDTFKNIFMHHLKTKGNDSVDLIIEAIPKEYISNFELLNNYLYNCILYSTDYRTINDFKITNIDSAEKYEYLIYCEFNINSIIEFGLEYYDYLTLESKETKRNIELYNMKSDGYAVAHEKRKTKVIGVYTLPINDIDSDDPNKYIDYNSIYFEVDEIIIKENI